MEVSHDTGPVQFIGSGADAVNHTLLLELGVQAWETKCLFNSLLLFFLLQFWYIRLVPELVYSIHVARDCRNVNKRFRRYPLQTVFDLRNNHTIGDVVHHKTLLKFSRITLFFCIVCVIKHVWLSATAKPPKIAHQIFGLLETYALFGIFWSRKIIYICDKYVHSFLRTWKLCYLCLLVYLSCKRN